VIRSDNGPQFISHAFQEGIQEFETEHERIPPRTPNMNAHIESYHRILEDKCFKRHQFQSYEEAYMKLQTLFDFIMSNVSTLVF
jgi:putative transposase